MELVLRPAAAADIEEASPGTNISGRVWATNSWRLLMLD